MPLERLHGLWPRLICEDVYTKLGHAHKRVVVTGSSKGIGFAIAQSFAQQGAEVFLNGRDAERQAFSDKCRRQAQLFLEQGSKVVAQEIGQAPTRIGLKRKDPIGWQRFVEHLSEHDPRGMANTLTMYQASRPSIQSFDQEIRQMQVPTLLFVGDQDAPCLQTNLYLKHALPNAQLLVYPSTGHAINLEEPAAFNAAVQTFFDNLVR